MLAFLTNVGEAIGPLSKYLHYGLTSSDILDTSLALLLKEASEIHSSRHPSPFGCLEEEGL